MALAPIVVDSLLKPQFRVFLNIGDPSRQVVAFFDSLKKKKNTKERSHILSTPPYAPICPGSRHDWCCCINEPLKPQLRGQIRGCHGQSSCRSCFPYRSLSSKFLSGSTTSPGFRPWPKPKWSKLAGPTGQVPGPCPARLGKFQAQSYTPDWRDLIPELHSQIVRLCVPTLL